MTKTLISVICPVHNEEANIAPFFARMHAVFQKLDAKRYDWEILFTNNCSTDRTLEEISRLRQAAQNVRVITFSRNFGYQPSIFAGLENAKGELFMIVDVDCEDPPEMLLEFLKAQEDGAEVVYGIRAIRDENAVMRAMRKLFYRLNRFLADYEIVLDMAEFFLITKPVRDAIISNRSNYPFLRAEIGYVGFSRAGIPYRRESRREGKTHYNLWRNFTFAAAGILSSSTLLLRICGFLGVPLLALNFSALSLCLYRRLTDQVVTGSGLAILMLVDFCFLIYTGIFCALYLARIYKNGLKRPLYFIDRRKSAF